MDTRKDPLRKGKKKKPELTFGLEVLHRLQGTEQCGEECLVFNREVLATDKDPRFWLIQQMKHSLWS